MKTSIKARPRRTPKFVAGLVAFSIAISGLSAMPARANDADVARAIGGLLTLFVISKAIDNASNSPTQTAHVPTWQQRQEWERQDRLRRERERREQARLEDQRREERRREEARKAKKRASSYEIDNTCVISVRGARDRIQTVALERCVKKTRKSAARLPRACETSVRTHRGRQDAYDIGCLNNFGYRVTRTTSHKDSGHRDH